MAKTLPQPDTKTESNCGLPDCEQIASFSHLNEKAQSYLELSDSERIDQIRLPIWIGYPVVRKLHEQLDDLFYHPKVPRMPNALVCGYTNAGKTVAVERWVRMKNDDEHNENVLPILMVQAPFEPDVRDFFIVCFRKVGAPYLAKDKPMQMQMQLGVILESLQTRMVVVDEVHHMTAGNPTQQHKFMNALKYISNDLQIPIVTIGTKNALVAFQQDQQIGNRFEPITVPRWENDEELGRLLTSFEHCTPLRQPSGLWREELAAKLHYLSEGLLGELATLLRRAAIAAIRTGRECITSTLLDGLGWVRPSERLSRASNDIK